MIKKSIVEGELARLNGILAGLAKEQEKMVSAAILRKAAHTVIDADSLSQELVDLLIDEILLFPDNHLEVH